MARKPNLFNFYRGSCGPQDVLIKAYGVGRLAANDPCLIWCTYRMHFPWQLDAIDMVS